MHISKVQENLGCKLSFEIVWIFFFFYTVKCHTSFSKLWPKKKKKKKKNRQKRFYSQNDTSRCCNKRPNWQFLSSNCQSTLKGQIEACLNYLQSPCAKINCQISSLCWIILSTQSFVQMNLLKRAVTHLPRSLPAMMGRRLTTSPMPRIFSAYSLKSWQQIRQQECSRRSSKGWSFSLDTLEKYNCGLNYKWILQAQETLPLSRLQELPSQYLYT